MKHAEYIVMNALGTATKLSTQQALLRELTALAATPRRALFWSRELVDEFPGAFNARGCGFHGVSTRARKIAERFPGHR